MGICWWGVGVKGLKSLEPQGFKELYRCGKIENSGRSKGLSLCCVDDQRRTLDFISMIDAVILHVSPPRDVMEACGSKSGNVRGEARRVLNFLASTLGIRQSLNCGASCEMPASSEAWKSSIKDVFSTMKEPNPGVYFTELP